MPTDWYYAEGGQKKGPISTSVLKQMAQMGDIGPETLIWKDGLSEWVHASRIQGLFPKGTPTVPPPIREPRPEVKVRVEPDISVRISKPKLGVLASTTKWIVIGWSVLCLFGVVYGIANVAADSSPAYTEAQQAGQAIGFGCGMFMWVFIWGAIAIPALVVWLVGQKR
jgi:hypothetical protein